MKKIVTLAMIMLMIFGMIPYSAYATGTDLIENVQMSLKTAETPKRLEVSFDLKEPINLSQGSSNIIFEYFSEDDTGNLKAIPYKKDKTWSGYLNSYDNYPSGERKYSSGAVNNTAYSDSVPATKIYTSTKTGASIDVTLVTAVRVTVFRADSSGEKIIIYSDGTTSPIEKIEVPVATEEKKTGIRLESTTAELPSDTILTVNEITGGSVHEMISAVLTDVTEFMAFEIKLESAGVEIQPNGAVRISIPIPEHFDKGNLAVYRIEADGTSTPYPVTVTAKDGIDYATFETDHFSIYVLASGLANEINEAEENESKNLENEAEEEAKKDETPKTGTLQTAYFMMPIAIISGIGILVFQRRKKI